jgi:hypothetical protein
MFITNLLLPLDSWWLFDCSGTTLVAVACELLYSVLVLVRDTNAWAVVAV